jgi:hypothetical protein
MVMEVEKKIDDDELEAVDIEVEQQSSYEDDELESDDHDSFSSGSEFHDASPLEVPFFITLSLFNDITMHIDYLYAFICRHHMCVSFTCCSCFRVYVVFNCEIYFTDLQCYIEYFKDTGLVFQL